MTNAPAVLPVIVASAAERPSKSPPTASAMIVSVLVHIAVGFALAQAAGVIAPRIEVSEAGRNSIALIASMEVEAPVTVADQLVVSAAPKSQQAIAQQESAAAIEAIAKHAELSASPHRVELAQMEDGAEKADNQVQENSLDGDDQGEKPPTPSQASPGSLSLRGADVDRLPSAVFNPAPVYPAEALRNRWSGRVVLRVKVAVTGRVLFADIATSSGIRQLDDAALVAVRQWRFTPAQRDGAPVEWEIGVPVRFVVQSVR